MRHTACFLLLLLTDEMSAINVLGSVGLAAPLQCTICENEENPLLEQQIDHYTNITVYKMDGQVVLGGLFPLQIMEKERGTLRYKNVALAEIMAWTIRHINDDPNVLPNITLGYEIRDSFANAPFASVQALELAAKNVFGVVGPGSSKVAVHLASLLGSLSFPMITYAATSDLLSDSTRFRMFARTVPSDEFQCRAMKDIIKLYGWNFVTIIHSPELYGSEGAGELRKILADDGIFVDKFHSLPEITTVEYVSEMLASTFEKNTTNSNRFHASVIVLFATTSYASLVIEGARVLRDQLGYNMSHETWIASESWSSDAEILNTFNSSHLGNFIGLKIKSFPLDDFVSYYRYLTPQNTTNPWFRDYYKHQYCGGDVSDCRNNMYDQGTYEEPVVLAVEAFAHTLHKMLIERQSGSLDPCVMAAKPIANTSDLFYLRDSGIGKCLYSELVSDTYWTRTRETIKFDEATGDFEAMYTFLTLSSEAESHGHIHNGKFQRDPIVDALIDIGVWNKSGIFLDNPSAPFRGRKAPTSVCSYDCQPGFKKINANIPVCWSCLPCEANTISNTTNSKECLKCGLGYRAVNSHTDCEHIFPTYLKHTHPAAIILILISVIGGISTIFTMMVFIHYRDTPLVKASSKELCMVLLVGISLGFMLPLFCIGLPTNEICLMQLVFGNMFGTLTIIPIFLKTARVYALFFQSQRSAGRAPRYLLPVWQSMLCMVLILVQMVFLMFTIIWYPLQRKEEYPNVDTVLVVCAGATSYNTIIALSVPVGYVMFFVIMSTILGYKVRKLPSNFQEAKYICLAQSIALIVIIAFVPSYFVTGGIWQKFCIGVASQICATSFLVLIFSKKVEIIVFYPERNKIVFEKDKLNKIDMTRKDRRKSFLASQTCHMCGHSLSTTATKVGLMQAATLLASGGIASSQRRSVSGKYAIASEPSTTSSVPECTNYTVTSEA